MKTVGLIGCGSVAEQRYLDVLSAFFSPYLKLFYDIDPSAAAILAKKSDGQTASLEALIDKSDFIIITTPPESHYELLTKSIKPGKSIFCEKPFLLSEPHAKHVIELSLSQKTDVYAGYIRRFFSAPNLARKFIQTGLLGDIKKVEVFEGARFTWYTHSGYHYLNQYGGVLFDTGSHALDTLLYVLGLDTGHSGFSLLTRDRMPDTEPAHVFKATFTIENEYKINGSVYLSRRKSLANKINIYGKNGVMEVPLDFKGAVKVSTFTGNSILRDKYPIIRIEEAFNRQFHHILFEDGELLKAERFLNVIKLSETLLKDPL